MLLQRYLEYHKKKKFRKLIKKPELKELLLLYEKKDNSRNKRMEKLTMNFHKIKLMLRLKILLFDYFDKLKQL